MSLEQIDYASHALKNFFEVVLHDENDEPLNWTKGLVISTNMPLMSFDVEEQEAGTRRGYTGWKLPDSINLTMYETRRHMLEKYLEDWMFSEHGIFDFDAGRFRAVDKESYLYRLITFRTITYETSLDGTRQDASETEVNIENIVEMEIESVIDKFESGDLSILKRWYTAAVDTDFFEWWVYDGYEGGNFMLGEFSKVQVIPVLDKVLSAAGGAINNAINKIPVVDNVLSPVVISPPTLKIPWISGTYIPIPTMSFDNNIDFDRRTVDEGSQEIKSFSTEDAMNAIQEVKDAVEKRLNDIPYGSSSERVTSSRTYRVALQSYDVGSYDYSSGDPVTYSLTLPVVDFSRPSFENIAVDDSGGGNAPVADS